MEIAHFERVVQAVGETRDHNRRPRARRCTQARTTQARMSRLKTAAGSSMERLVDSL